MTAARRQASLLVVFATVFIDLLGFGMVLPLLPVYARRFMIEESGLMLGLLMASFSAMQFVCAPLWGRLSDRVGRRPVLLTGLAGSVAFYTLFGVAALQTSLALLFLSRIGAGIFGATIPTAQAYIADITSRENRAQGMALIGAAFGLGFTFGPLISAAALSHGGAVETSPWPGFAAAGLSAIALMIGVFFLEESWRPDAAAAGHWRMLDVQALRDALATPSVAALIGAAFVAVLAFANFESTLSLLLNDKRSFGYDFKQVLLVFAYIGFTLTIAQGVLVRRLAKRFRETSMAMAGTAVSAVGMLLLAYAGREASLPWLIFGVTVQLGGFAFVIPSLNSLISRRSDPAKQGGILGLLQSTGSLARVAGPVAGNLLFARATTLPFFAAAALMALNVALIARAGRGGHDYAS